MSYQNFFTAVHLRDEYASVHKGYAQLFDMIKRGWGKLYLDFDCQVEATMGNIQNHILNGDPTRGVLLYSSQYEPALKVQYQTLELF